MSESEKAKEKMDKHHVARPHHLKSYTSGLERIEKWRTRVTDPSPEAFTA